MTANINHQFLFSQVPEAVWEYLTNPELMELWLMKNNFQLVIGHEFQFRTKPAPSVDFDGIFYCRVLEIVPFKKLSYSWKCGPGEGRIAIDSVVTWTLLSKGTGTLLFLDHGNFAVMENFALYNSMIDGWLKNIQKIADRLNTTENGPANT